MTDWDEANGLDALSIQPDDAEANINVVTSEGIALPESIDPFVLIRHDGAERPYTGLMRYIAVTSSRDTNITIQLSNAGGHETRVSQIA